MASLVSLAHLYLTENALEDVHEQSFAHNSRLQVLLLAANRLTRLPNVAHNAALKHLDVSAQQGLLPLERVPAYAFQCGSPQLSVNLAGNDKLTFDARALCSSHSSSFSNDSRSSQQETYRVRGGGNIVALDVSYKTATLGINKCVLKQLSRGVGGGAMLRIGVPPTGPNSQLMFNCSTNSSYYSLCELSVYARKIGVQVSGGVAGSRGACQLVSKCNSTSLISKLNDNNEFNECDTLKFACL